MGTIFDRLDPDQRAAVSWRINGAVSAGAGSGKTTVLAARYLDLLLSSGADVGSILCLTFTRKAAAEMRSRIWLELNRHDDPRAKAQAERFAEASISTIDSFCGLILRSSAQTYGYPPDFKVDDEARRELVESEALRFLLARRERPALVGLFAKSGFEGAWKELFAKVADLYSSPAPRPEDDLRAVPAKARVALIRIARKSLAAIDLLRDEALTIGSSSSKAGGASLAIFSALPADLLAALPETVGGDEGADLALLLGPAAALVAPFLGIALYFGRSDNETRLKEATKLAREAAGRLAACVEAGSQRPLENAVIAELADFVEEVSEAKRRAGLMGFRDVAVAAVHLLSTNLEIRAWWKKRYRYIMVDEFQDDDELQKELLYLLAEAPERLSPGLPEAGNLAPDKLFFVGDDKQSIFRFRGADVSVFNRLSAELASGAETPSPILRTNYRSEPALIEFFNGLFSRLLASKDGADFEARFEEALSRPPHPGLEPSLTLLWKPRGRGEGDDFRSEDEALAEGTVRHLKKLIDGGRLLLPDGAGTRAAGWDDVAILFRSTSKQYLMERFLRLHGVPYSAASVRSLFVESLALDLFAFLKLALLPGDRPSFAAWLRSPFVGLSDEAFVLVLASERGVLDSFADLDLSQSDLRRIGAGQELLGELAARIDREPLAELLSWLWYEGGQRLSLLGDPENHPFLEHFDYLFALAADSDARGENLAHFKDRLGPLLGTPEKLDENIEVPRESAHGLRLMSIHRSKGLEFPIVVLPWIEGGGRKEGAGRLWYLSSEAGLSLSLRAWDDPKAVKRNVFYDEARELEEAKELAEIKRLFYVGCTRAATHLIFAGIEPSRKVSSSSFLSFLGGAPRPDGQIDGLGPSLVTEQVPDLDAASYGRLVGRRGGRSLSSFGVAYDRAAILDRSYQQRIVAATEVAASAWRSDPRRETRFPSLPPSAYDSYADRLKENVFGDLCHAVLEFGVRGQPFPTEHPSLRPLSPDARPILLAEAERLASLFFASPLGSRVPNAIASLTEKALLLSIRKEVLRCRLDLVLVFDAEILVVDWKSGREKRSPEYEMQLCLYRRALASIYPGRVVRSLLFWLRSGESEELDVEIEDEELVIAIRGASMEEEAP